MMGVWNKIVLGNNGIPIWGYICIIFILITAIRELCSLVTFKYVISDG